MVLVRNIIVSNKGLTLVELLVGMAMITLLMATALTTLAASVNIWQTGKTRSEIENVTRYALDVIVREVRFASSLELKSKSELMIIRNNGEKITFQYVSPAKIIYKVTDNSATGGGIAKNPLTTAVIDGLSFDIDGNKVKIIIQATSYTGGILEYSTRVNSLNIDT